MSRARSHASPNITGKLSFSDTLTRFFVSWTVHRGLPKASNVAFSAAVIPTHPSTNVLSQSNSSTVGLCRGDERVMATPGLKGQWGRLLSWHRRFIRHGTARPGHLSMRRVDADGPDKPGHDEVAPVHDEVAESVAHAGARDMRLSRKACVQILTHASNEKSCALSPGAK